MIIFIAGEDSENNIYEEQLEIDDGIIDYKSSDVEEMDAACNDQDLLCDY